MRYEVNEVEDHGKQQAQEETPNLNFFGGHVNLFPKRTRRLSPRVRVHSTALSLMVLVSLFLESFRVILCFSTRIMTMSHNCLNNTA